MVARIVYFSVNTTESTKNRLSTAAVKLSGKLIPWSPESSGQSDALIRNTSTSGTTNRTRTNRAVGDA